MEALIVSGASRGLGASLLATAPGRYEVLIGMARSGSYEGLSPERVQSRIRVDLSRPEELSAAARSLVMGFTGMKGLTGITCIHNAGSLQPMGMARNHDADDLDRSFQLNLVAPMALSTSLMNFSRGSGLALTLVFISSAAAVKSFPGWSAYGAAKAALESYARTLALEEPSIRVLIVNPGIMDTPMQAEIRSQRPEDFPLVDRFRSFKDQGNLVDPAVVARSIFNELSQAVIPSGGTLVSKG